MDKLIELLNEYDWVPTEWKQIWDKIYFDWLGWNSELHELIIISKYYGFIKWLVDNDKIDFYEWKYLENPIWSNNYDECDYLELIQWLAISDTPIKDLIYYLK